MADTKQENPKLLRALFDFEKELVKANNFLKQNSASLNQSLKQISLKAKELEDSASCDADSAMGVSKALEEKKLLQFYSQLAAQVSELKKSIVDFEDKSAETEVFLESFRRERTYAFNNEQSALDFLQQLFSLYAISNTAFRPEFVGVIDLNEIAAQLKLEKKDKQSLLIDASRLSALFALLKKKNAAKNFHLDSAEIKLLVKNPLQLKVETDNAKIKRLDRLAIELEAGFE